MAQHTRTHAHKHINAHTHNAGAHMPSDLGEIRTGRLHVPWRTPVVVVTVAVAVAGGASVGVGNGVLISHADVFFGTVSS